MAHKRIYDAYMIYSNVVKRKSLKTFCHKHMENPDIVSDLAVLVDYQNNDPAGMIAFLGSKVHIGKQNEIIALLGSDSAVLERYRRRHIYTNLMLQAIQYGEKKGISIIYGFPNQTSYPGCKKMGFKDLGSLGTCALIMRPFSFLLSLLSHKARKCLPFENEQLMAENECIWTMSLTCPFSENDLRIINYRSGIHFHRSIAAFNWKIDSMTGETAYICVRKKQQLCAYFVIRKNKYGICDLLDYYLPDDKRFSRYCLKTFVKSMMKYSNGLVARAVNPDNAMGHQIWKKLLIRKKKTPFIVYLISNQINDIDKLKLQTFSEWSVTYFDCDVILDE